MAKVIMTLPLPGRAEALLRERCQVETLGEILSPERYQERIAGADALLPQLRDRIDSAALDAAGPRLRVVSNYAVGLDNVDIPTCTARGIYVGNTPLVLTDATADLALALILATARRVVEGDREMRQGRYLGWHPDYLLGREVTGATLGVVGFGRIGRAVAHRAHLGFGMRVLAYDPQGVSPEEGVPVEALPLEELLRHSDFVSCHVPLSESTHHLLGAPQFRLMRRSAILVNTSRGPVVDEQALVQALIAGEIAGAGLDVYEHEPLMAAGLARLPNAVLLPHLGSATVETRSAMGELAARNILRVLDGGVPEAWANPELGGRR